jgi:hypothetical protein
MANELLDFVMNLLRDPDAAARFAENPDQVIHDANLTNVSGADVSNLIPVVAESLSSAVPTTGADAVGHEVVNNVWASGAATAAFDAFDDHLPVQTIDDAHSVISDFSGIAQPPDPAVHAGLDAISDPGVPGVLGADDVPMHLDHPVIDDVPIVDPQHGLEADHHSIVEVADMDSDPSGFDIF